MVSVEDQPAPVSRGLNCPNCGAAVELRAGELTRVVGCAACGSLLDATDPNLAVLQRFAGRMKVEPLIPLGTKGTLGGEPWQAIGFQVRDVTVEGVAYAWREYLLWNPYRGYRYLTEYDGHWNDVVTIKGAPEERGGGAQATVSYGDQLFRHFQSATATTRFVVGEFPWEVRVGDEARADDYVAPPRMLSRETAAGEVTWSLGTYTAPERIAEAFKLQRKLPGPRGVYADQPNPHRASSGAYWRTFGVLAAALVALMIVRLAAARNETVFEQTYRYDQAAGDTVPFVTPVFELGGHRSNVEVTTRADLTNDWAYFNLALINTGTGDAYDFGRELSYYEGYDGGERWHEGSRSDRAVVPSVPPGRYYLRVEPERDPGGNGFGYTIRLRRDVPRVTFFLLALVLLVVPPVVSAISAHSFEASRWQESDHPPVSLSSADDDE